MNETNPGACHIATREQKATSHEESKCTHAVLGGGKICCPRFQKECNNKYDRMREGNEEGEPNAVMAANEVALTNAGWEKGCCVAKRREGMRVCVCGGEECQEENLEQG